MVLKEIHICGPEMEVLVSTAAMGNYTLGELIAAAAWTFANQDDHFKKYYLRKVWFLRGPSLPQPQYQSPKEKILPWHTVGVPPAVKRFLPKNGRDDFSSVQKLAAAIQMFTGLPLSDRLELAREYTASSRIDQGTSDDPMTSPESTLTQAE
jgi:hypothetical protein